MKSFLRFERSSPIFADVKSCRILISLNTHLLTNRRRLFKSKIWLHRRHLTHFLEISAIELSYLFLRSAMIETLVELKEGPEETTEIPFWCVVASLLLFAFFNTHICNYSFGEQRQRRRQKDRLLLEFRFTETHLFGVWSWSERRSCCSE